MKHLKRMGAALLPIVIVLSAFSGCSALVMEGKPVAPEDRKSSSVLEGSLNITGSTSMQEVCDALGAEFMEKYPAVKVTKGGNGSGEAPAAVLDGTAQIGDLSREMQPEERPEQFEQRKIAVDGIALAVNSENPVTNLTKRQVADIYSGKITDWKQVGGNPGPITLIGRDAASGTRESFEAIFDVEKQCKYSVELNSTGEVKSKIQSDKGAIGYISFGSIDSSVVPLSVDGAEPTEENVKAGEYQIYRPFLQITKRGLNDELTDAWFSFVYSPEGARIISDVKLIPMEQEVSEL